MLMASALGGGALLVAHAAYSAPKAAVFLHFGSFEVADEAESRLKQVKTKHAGLISDLPGLVREVEIRPGLKVFRTQAGPVKDRSQAQSICAQLASNGDECYIVETVLKQQDIAPKEATQLAVQGDGSLAKTRSADAGKTASAATQSEDVPAPLQALPEEPAAIAQAVKQPQPAALQEAAKQETARASGDINQLYDTLEAQASEDVSAPKASAVKKIANATAREPITQTAKAIKAGSSQTLSSSIPRDAGSRRLLADLQTDAADAPKTDTLPIRVLKQQGEGVDIASREASIEDALAKARASQPVVVPKTTEEIQATTRETAWYDTINPFHEEGEADPIKEVAQAEQAKRDGATLESVNPFSGGRDTVSPASTPRLQDVVRQEQARLDITPQPISNQHRSTPDIAPDKPEETFKPAQLQRLPAPPQLPVEERFETADAEARTRAQALQSTAQLEDLNTRSAISGALSVPDLPPPPLPPTEQARRALANEILREPIAASTRAGQDVQTHAAPLPAKTEIARAELQETQPFQPLTAPPAAEVIDLSPPPPTVDLSPPPSYPQDGQFTVFGQNGLKNAKTETITPVPAEDAPPIPAGISITQAAQITAEANAKAQEKARLAKSENVAVEEALRVPLSEEEVYTPPPPPPVIAQAAPLKTSLADLPSQTDYKRTLWAHMSFFENKQDALRFWQKFRDDNPDFPSVRVRVTSAYVSQVVGRESVSLRVGPFANAAFISELCEHDLVDDEDLECRGVRDLGSAGFVNQVRRQAPGHYQPGRYGRDGHGTASPQGVWVQLGSYTSASQAEAAWDALKIAHKHTLRSMRSKISSPQTGSQTQPVYRLRTGPFVDQLAASEMCLRLKETGTSCLVVAEY